MNPLFKINFVFIGHSEDVGLICTGVFWNLERRNITGSLLQFFGEGKSSLTNVRIRAVQQYQAVNSTPSEFLSSSAILCDGGCPYVTNVNISDFDAALTIRDHADILLRNIKILNCFYGIVALNHRANSTSNKTFSKSHVAKDMFRLEKITVNNSYWGVLVHPTFPIQLKDITITHCSNGVFISKTMFTTVPNHSTFPIQLRDITITNCNSGVFISKTMFTKVKISGLTLDTGVNAITIRTTPGHFEHVDLCGSGNNSTYNASFPVEITHESYSYYGRSPCSMVGFDIV